jgi:multicomponent Na+:H+ antiporter subunit C
MTLFMAIVIGILFAVSVYMMFGRELKEVCMGIFLLSHAANLAIMEAGRVSGRLFPPVLGEGQPVNELVDPLPHALILTAIVIGFAVQGFILTLLVVTWRRAGTVDTGELAGDEAKPDKAHG